MSAYELHHGDMLEVMPTLAKGSVSLVFADLPYGSTDCSYDGIFSVPCFWPKFLNVTRQNGSGVFTADLRFAARLLAVGEKYFRYDLIWDKVNRSTGWLNAKRAPLRRHEFVTVFAKKGHIYNPQMTKGTPYTVSCPKGKYPSQHYGNRPTVANVNAGIRYPVSIVPFAAKKDKRLHPSQKPVALLEWLIATYTHPGDTVLDPCFGSGTTGVACANLGRKFIGIEKDATYFAAGKARIEKAYADAAAGSIQTSLAV